jgi:hypothetical protein
MYDKVSEDDATPFIICMLVDWFGPDRTRKSLNVGATKFFNPFISLPSNIKFN